MCTKSIKYFATLILTLFLFAVLVPYSHCGEDSAIPGEGASAWHGTLDKPVFSSDGCCSVHMHHADADHVHFLVNDIVIRALSDSKDSIASPVTVIVANTSPFRAGPVWVTVEPESSKSYSTFFSGTVSGLAPPVV